MSHDHRFPTYEAEERRARMRPPGVAQVPLTGTPAPALPPHVVTAVTDVLTSPMSAPPVHGIAALRSLLAVELERTTGHLVDPESELLITNGAMQALGVCFRALLEPGDEVVVPSPCFFFGGAIAAAGGVPVYVPGSPIDAWRWDPTAVEAAISTRTRALVLCNPGNPTGYVPSRNDLVEVLSIAERHGLLVVTDEAYEAALWDDATLVSAFGLHEDVVVVRSLGKSLSLPQLRIGVLAGPATRVASCTRTLEWDCLRVSVGSQAAALAALEGPKDWLQDVRHALATDRSVAVAAVEATAGLTAVVPQATPFLFVGSSTPRELADELVGVGLPVVDGAAFQAPGYARLPFGGAAEARDGLHQALSRWAELYAE